MIFCGVDAGARATKVVLVDERGAVLARALRPTSTPPGRCAGEAVEEALGLSGAHAGEISATTATGYGRNAVEAGHSLTEISCHLKGAVAALPGVRTVIDIGGQDSKVIAAGARGEVEDFVMNDRCAAGTGRFLEVISGILGVSVEDLSQLAARATEPAPISAVCVVFTESEVVSLVSQGYDKADIAAGVVQAMAARMQALMGRLVTRAPALFVGGVAGNGALAAELAAVTGLEIEVGTHPQFNGARGAALFSLENSTRSGYTEV